MTSNNRRYFNCCDYRVLLFGCLTLQLGGWWLWTLQVNSGSDDGRLAYSKRRLLAVDGLEAGARGKPPPFIESSIEGDVQEYSWTERFEQEQACVALRNYIEDPPPKDELIEPLVIRRAVDWPALRLWNFSMIANLNLTADVWISPTFKFFYCDPVELKRFVKHWGASKAPSFKIDMLSEEAIFRMQESSNYSSIIYPGEEQYYLRVDLPDVLKEQVSFTDGPFSCLQHSSKGRPWQPGEPRLWLSQLGAISPLHYDRAQSCLVQIRGRKQMLLYDSKDASSLYPYPETHLMKRRFRVDPTAPHYEQFPKFQDAAGRQAIIEPGDMICFPRHWPHYTHSMDASISVTIRF